MRNLDVILKAIGAIRRLRVESGVMEFLFWKNHAGSNVKDAMRRGEMVGREWFWKTCFYHSWG